MTSPVKLVGKVCYRTRFQASSGNSDSANWPGYEAVLVHCFPKFCWIERRGVTSHYHGSTIISGWKQNQRWRRQQGERSSPGGSRKLVSAAVRCVGSSWRHTKVRRATSRIFENGGVIVFYVNTLSLFFPVNEAAMWFLFSSRIPLPHIPTEKVSVFWLLRKNSAKKVVEAFWWVSKLGKLWECGEEFRWTKTRFSLDKKHEKTCSFAPK